MDLVSCRYDIYVKEVKGAGFTLGLFFPGIVILGSSFGFLGISIGWGSSTCSDSPKSISGSGSSKEPN
jgi:hypothetical protein